MKKYSYGTVLMLSFLLCYGVTASGQGKFNDSKKDVWIKGFTTAKALKEVVAHPVEESANEENANKELETPKKEDRLLNGNSPIQFSNKFKVLNTKYQASKYTHVFYVLKSKETSKKLFSLFHAGNLHRFYTDKILSDTETALDISAFEKGSMVHFNFYNKDFHRKDKGLFFLENFQAASDSELYEVLVCNNCSDKESQYKIETYLAIKYGITLVHTDRYLASDNRQVWDSGIGKEFNKHIIGIGRDDYFNLKQTASSSNTDNTVVLSASNLTPDAVWNNYTYVVMADNNGEKRFDAKTGVFKRKWLVQNQGDQDVRFDLTLDIQPNPKHEYQMVGSHGLVWSSEETDSLQLNFKGLEIRSKDHYYLSVTEEKVFFFEIDKIKDGFNTNFLLGVKEGGTPPYHITALNKDTNESFAFVSEGSVFDLKELPKATYSFTVRDRHEREAVLLDFELDQEASVVQLDPNWILEKEKSLLIKPQIASKELENSLQYRWYVKEGGNVLSTAPSFLVTKQGDYVLELSDKSGRKNRMPFTVKGVTERTSVVDSGWKVSPNPIDRGQEFTVTYAFDQAKNVDFYIYTLEGKFILRDRLGVLKDGTFQYTLEGATTYLLVAMIDEKASLLKLLVK